MPRHITFVSRPMRVPQRAQEKYYPGPPPIWECLVCPLLEKLGLEQLAAICEAAMGLL
jgi:hypothetical protein